MLGVRVPKARDRAEDAGQRRARRALTKLTTRTRCSGHCCREVLLAGGSISRRRLETLAVEAAANGFIEWVIEAAYVIDMLVPVVGPSPSRTDVWRTESSHAYACRHFDGTSSCTAYEARPRLCRDYPYGRACSEPGCTWDDEEARLVSWAEDCRTRGERADECAAIMDARHAEQGLPHEPRDRDLVQIGRRGSSDRG